MSPLDFGVVLQTDPPARDVVEGLRAAEDCGFRYGWTFDSAVSSASATVTSSSDGWTGRKGKGGFYRLNRADGARGAPGAARASQASTPSTASWTRPTRRCR
jgi:hypothetical protein